MVYSQELNQFFKNRAELSNDEKIEKLKDFSTGNLLTLLRNIEESPTEYAKEVISGVYGCLRGRGIMCT